MRLSIETINLEGSRVQVTIGDFSLNLPENPLEISQDAMFWLTLMLAQQIGFEYGINTLFNSEDGVLKIESMGVYSTLFMRSNCLLRPIWDKTGKIYDENSVLRLMNSIVIRLTTIKDRLYIERGI